MTRRSDHAKSKQRRARRQAHELTFRDAWNVCPFRTLVGVGTDAEEMMRRVGCSIVVLGEEPEALSQRMLADALAVLNTGQTVLLLSNNRPLRDFAQRELATLAGPAAGSA